MKKLIAIAVVLALVAGVAFAQTANGIQVQAWGRGAFSPITAYGAPQDGAGNVQKVPGTNDDMEGESYAGVTPTWGSGQDWSSGKARVDIRINGNSDYVGFGFNGTFENYEFNDNAALIWAKPFGSDILKLTVGMFVDDTLRGKIGNLDGGFSNFVLGGDAIFEEDPIFQSFSVGEGRGNSVFGDAPAGFMLSSAPIDGLFIGILVKGKIADAGNSTRAADAFRYMHIGAGYNIANIGHIRAQYIGGWSGTVDPTDKEVLKSKAGDYDLGYAFYESWALESVWDSTVNNFVDRPKIWAGYGAGISFRTSRIEAAFALTAVEGLLVDLGGKFHLPLELKDQLVVSKGVDFSLGATYNSGAFGIGARVDISGLGAYLRTGTNYKDSKSESGATTVIRLVPTYAIGDASIGLDVAFALKGKNKDFDGKEVDKSDGNQIGFGAFVSKGLGNGNIRAGLSYTLAPNNGDGKPVGSGVFQIPIILEYAFF